MKIEDRKSCEYRFSLILIDFDQCLSMISIASGNRLDFRYICATHYKHFLLQKRDLSSAFPQNVLKLRKT